MFARLKQLYLEVKNQNDLTYKSIPFFQTKMREIRVELIKISAQQGEQLSRDVSDALRLITITEREDLSNIESYPKEVPKYLGRVKTSVMANLAFVGK
ncbi:hypothetical protein BH09BAC3_BH09BAC3_13340 [soil metagenome]